MEDQSLSLLPDLIALFLGELLNILLLEERVHLVQKLRDKDLLYQLNHSICKEIEQEVLSYNNNYYLKEYNNNFCYCNDIGLNVVLLLSIYEAVLVRHKITADCIEQEDQIIDSQFPDSSILR